MGKDKDPYKKRVKAELEQARSKGIRPGRPPLVQLKEKKNQVDLFYKKSIIKLIKEYCPINHDLHEKLTLIHR